MAEFIRPPHACAPVPPTETPPWLARYMCEWAEIGRLDTVLEPSAGFGNIAQELRNWVSLSNLVLVELNKARAYALQERGFLNVQHRDFIGMSASEKFDAVVMCPPMAAVAHIMHAVGFLKPGGVLVALYRADSPGAWVLDKIKDFFNQGEYTSVVEIREVAVKVFSEHERSIPARVIKWRVPT